MLRRTLRQTTGHTGPRGNPETIGKQPLWNVEQVSAYLSISKRTVRDLVYKRQIPYRKAGRCLRFDPVEIEHWTYPHEAIGSHLILRK